MSKVSRRAFAAGTAALALGAPSIARTQKKVPQLFVATGASKWGNPKEFPWTMGWQPDYATEASIYAKHIMANHPNGKVAMLYQNDDSGKDYLNGFIAGFGKDKDKFLIKTVSYEVT